MQLDILHLQGAGLAMPSKLAGCCHHTLDKIISNLQQHLGKTKGGRVTMTLAEQAPVAGTTVSAGITYLVRLSIRRPGTSIWAKVRTRSEDNTRNTTTH